MLATHASVLRTKWLLHTWWVKERYRSMRGYKRPASVLNVSRLIAAMGNALDGPGFALAEIIA